jgi:hypothetical protein
LANSRNYFQKNEKKHKKIIQNAVSFRIYLEIQPSKAINKQADNSNSPPQSTKNKLKLAQKLTILKEKNVKDILQVYLQAFKHLQPSDRDEQRRYRTRRNRHKNIEYVNQKRQN